jgi:hypothetical protein
VEKAAMKRFLIALGLGVFAVLQAASNSFTARAATSASPGRRPAELTCTLPSYDPAATTCVLVPRKGYFSLKVKNTKIRIYGQGDVHHAGTEIDVTPISNPCRNSHAQSFKILVNGPMPHMNVAESGTLYRSPLAGTCVKTGFVYCTPGPSPCVFEFAFSPYTLSSRKGKKHGH